MRRDKQIEEMANEIYETLMLEAECPLSGMDCAIIADLLVGKGYRKASEVAEEIFAEADKIFMDNCLSLESYGAWLELKKKYTEGGE